MTGKDRPSGAAAAVSTGGSLISDTKLQALYRHMVHARLLAEHAAGVSGKTRSTRPFAASLGQEALAAGWVIDLKPEDSVALATGDAIPSLVKGVPLAILATQLYAGSAEAQAHVAAHHVIPASSVLPEECDAIVATAFENKRKKKSHVVVAFASAPTTALAPWHEMLTLARKKNLPIVFVVENNPWVGDAAHAPEPGDDFTQKARGYGMTGIPVDGNDVVAVYRVAFESLDRVRHGDGPVMVEGRTYSESGRSKRNRSAERDPLLRMERYLKAKKLFPAGWKDRMVENFSQELKAAAKAARKSKRASLR